MASSTNWANMAKSVEDNSIDKCDEYNSHKDEECTNILSEIELKQVF